ncbi:unnamed protein product [Caenorhabditis auriculariae]|uniref:Uncharacterized protein n=1 Tax=Caenorhabditis auriculariae TaxID=2777116 RepID=A0A8S1H6W0_9PELO|nr:unnamed protein product [Caenorhabditis auriculariae]
MDQMISGWKGVVEVAPNLWEDEITVKEEIIEDPDPAVQACRDQSEFYRLEKFLIAQFVIFAASRNFWRRSVPYGIDHLICLQIALDGMTEGLKKAALRHFLERCELNIKPMYDEYMALGRKLWPSSPVKLYQQIPSTPTARKNVIGSRPASTSAPVQQCNVLGVPFTRSITPSFPTSSDMIVDVDSGYDENMPQASPASNFFSASKYNIFGNSKVESITPESQKTSQMIGEADSGCDENMTQYNSASTFVSAPQFNTFGSLSDKTAVTDHLNNVRILECSFRNMSAPTANSEYKKKTKVRFEENVEVIPSVKKYRNKGARLNSRKTSETAAITKPRLAKKAKAPPKKEKSTQKTKLPPKTFGRGILRNASSAPNNQF